MTSIDDRPTTDRRPTLHFSHIFENFNWPQLCNGWSDPLKWF